MSWHVSCHMTYNITCYVTCNVTIYVMSSHMSLHMPHHMSYKFLCHISHDMSCHITCHVMSHCQQVATLTEQDQSCSNRRKSRLADSKLPVASCNLPASCQVKLTLTFSSCQQVASYRLFSIWVEQGTMSSARAVLLI